MKDAQIQQIRDYFKPKTSFSRQELMDYFALKEGAINPRTLGWRIYDLKQKSIIHELKRGVYTLNKKPEYYPPVDPGSEKLARIFQEHFRDAGYCTWNMNILNEFTQHQFTKDLLLFEVEKDLIESALNIFGDNGYTVFRLFQGSLITWSNIPRPVVIMPLITRAPVQKIAAKNPRQVCVPTLEKLLVDIYNDEKVFGFLQGSELRKIYENALNRYMVNYTTLFSYARRRGKELSIREYLREHFQSILKTVIP